MDFSHFWTMKSAFLRMLYRSSSNSMDLRGREIIHITWRSCTRRRESMSDICCYNYMICPQVIVFTVNWGIYSDFSWCCRVCKYDKINKYKMDNDNTGYKLTASFVPSLVRLGSSILLLFTLKNLSDLINCCNLEIKKWRLVSWKLELSCWISSSQRRIVKMIEPILGWIHLHRSFMDLHPLGLGIPWSKMPNLATTILFPYCQSQKEQWHPHHHHLPPPSWAEEAVFAWSLGANQLLWGLKASIVAATAASQL